MKLSEMFIDSQKYHICQNIEIILFSQKLTQNDTKFTHAYTEYPRYAENQV